jgi:CTP synthase (UTP-ammonia lyase)
MAARPRIAVIGDYSDRNQTHRATNAELSAAGVSFEWVPTPAIGTADESLRRFDGLWISPGSPYASMDGALAAVRYAREIGVPLVGT